MERREGLKEVRDEEEVRVSEEVKLFKKGDKVRCTGHMWGPEYKDILREVAKDQTDPEYLQFPDVAGEEFGWYLGNGWGVELVEEYSEDELVEPVKPSHRFEVGDTIRLTGEEWGYFIKDGDLSETVEVAEILESVSTEQATHYLFKGYEDSGDWYVDSDEFAAEKVEMAPEKPKEAKKGKHPRPGDKVRVNKRGAINTVFQRGDLGVIRDEGPFPKGGSGVYTIDFVDGTEGALYSDEFKVLKDPAELSEGTVHEGETVIPKNAVAGFTSGGYLSGGPVLKTPAGPYPFTFTPTPVTLGPEVILKLSETLREKMEAPTVSTPSVIEENDPVEHPEHYQFPNGVEVLDIIRHLGFLEGSVIKYVARAGRKAPETRLEDLRKARQCLDTLIADVEDEERAL